MLKYHNYDIVFQEIPDETTLAINLTQCPNHCEGCHSPHLMENIGTIVNTEFLDLLLQQYDGLITCICWMGGDKEPELIDRFSAYIRNNYPLLKIGWYSGKAEISPAIQLSHFDYIKIGPFIKDKGALKVTTTNQRLFKINTNGQMEDITHLFWNK